MEDPAAVGATVFDPTGVVPGIDLSDLDEFVEAERGVLVELHAAVTEDRAAALLTAGDALTAVTVLQAAVRDEPYRERRWELDSRAVTGLAAESWQHVDTV